MGSIPLALGPHAGAGEATSVLVSPDEAESRPFVSIVIPCRNERGHIAPCLDSILDTDYPIDRLEILVVDGASDDGTRDILAEYTVRHPCVRCLDNPRRITPVALNIGIQEARGEIIMRMDAHSRYPRNYIGGLVGWLERSGADNVGGVWRTLPANDGTKARAIATALAHPFAVGAAHYRLGVREPRWVDTVPFGCYRRSVFSRIGLFDEELVRNQDDEFNHRLLKHGGRILLVPDVSCDYFARESIAKLARMFYQYGYFKPLVVRKLGGIFTVRQLVPPLFVAALFGTLLLASVVPRVGAAFVGLAILYGAAVAACALRAAASAGFDIALPFAAAFPVIHLSYGVGFLRGILDFVLRRKRGDRNAAAIPVTR